MSSSSPSFPQHRMDLMLCRCRMWAPPTSLCLGPCQLTVMASSSTSVCIAMVLWRVSCPLLGSATHHQPPPLHFVHVHVHVCLLCYCVQHAQITVCMVHVYDLCSVRYLLDRSSSHAHKALHSSWNVVLGVISAAASLPRYIVYTSIT